MRLGHLPLLVFVGLAGCAAFKPPPPDFLEWTAPGKSVVDVKKRLLECGMPEPSGTDDTYQKLGRNAQILITVCMMHAGFQSETDYLLCDHERDRILPACAPGAEIPKPSVSRRLNGSYCKAKTDYQYCKQNARHPTGCDNNDYDNPRPECLP